MITAENSLDGGQVGLKILPGAHLLMHLVHR
jgi:hypothetical protein